MKGTEISGTESAYAVNLNRYDKESREMASDFLAALSDEFHRSGYVDSVQATSLRVPAQLLRQPRPVRGGEPISLTIAIAVFLGTTIGAWTVEKICDGILDKIKPAFRSLWDRIRGKKKPEPEQLFLRFGVWYDNDQVYVNVIAPTSGPNDYDALLQLLPMVERAVYDWRLRNPNASRVLTYRIVDGKIPDEPSQSETIPTE